MSNRNWVFVVATGLVLSLSAALAQDSSEQPVTNQSGSARQDQGGDQRPEPFSVSVRILEEPEQSESAKREQQEANQREIDDLLAQQGMNEATNRIVALTLAQTILAFFGTIALLYSLFLNRKATLAAVSAAEIAQQAIGAERAWLVLSGQQITQTKNDSVNFDEMVGISLRWKNLGRSPALNVQQIIISRIVDDDSTILADSPIDQQLPQGFAVIGPNLEVSSAILWLTGDSYEAVRTNKRFLFVYGQVDYTDTFHPNVKRTTRVFAHGFMDIRENDQGVMRPHLTLRPVGAHNTAT